MSKYKKSLFLFRRDLRVNDNTGLIYASKASSKVVPCFIFDTNILKSTHNKSSKFRMNFFHETLIDLNSQLKDKKSHLHMLEGLPEKIIQNTIKECGIDAVFVNRDYTPFSKTRDEKILNMCEKQGVDFISTNDLLLHEPEEIENGKGEPYKVFSPFFSKCKELPIRKPQKYIFSNLANEKIKSEIPIKNIQSQLSSSMKTEFNGGRKSCITLLKTLKNLKNYDRERNYPYIEGTSHLSAHNKFGTCSIREIYHKIVDELGINHTLVTELHWRDFFTHIMYHFPFSKSKEFHSKYEKIPWSQNPDTFTKWCEGITGFPIVDAGMRELNSTGYMHNRVRMIVASFLTKDLHIDWRLGENYFASKLIDYDSSVNVGNWQWAASTGCDAQPWFRIFNPWLQQQKFDKDCLYIKKWIPELDSVSPKIIHSLNTKHSEIDVDYPAPIVDHKSESQYSKEVFKGVSSA